MIYIAVLAAAVVIWWMWRVSRLNSDPLQKEVAAQIVAMVHDEFSRESQNRLIRTAISLSTQANRTKLSTRLPHALSMVRLQLTPSQYETAREIIKDLSMNSGR